MTPDLPIADDAERPTEPAPPVALEVAFTGSAVVYFRIWIVNLCLTLLTLGIFSAWAKVRKKRYFYSSIRIDDTPLQYLAEPLPILKGRVVAAVLVASWWFSSNFFLPALPWVLGVALIVAPWVVASSAAFNARYSAWRGLTFVFHGNYLGAAGTIYWLGLIPLLVIALALDAIELSSSEFAIWGPGILFGLAGLVFGLVFPWWLNRLKRFIATHTAYGSHRVRYGARGGQFFGVYFVAGLVLALGGTATGVLLFNMESTARSTVGFIILSLPLYLAYVLAFAYVRAKITNLVWNQAALGPVTFQSSLDGPDLFALYLTNALAIIGSLGMAIPWAVMRTQRYRIEHLEAQTSESLATFIGTDLTAVTAAGAETGDFFDLDLSL